MGSPSPMPTTSLEPSIAPTMTPTMNGDRDEWNIAPPQIAKDPNVTMGLILQHTISGYPDDCNVTLYDFECDHVLEEQDGVTVTAKSYSSNPNIFMYDLLVDTEKVRNSPLVSFELGFTVGNLRFCTHVESLYNDLAVSFLNSKLTLEFNLANNTFTDGVSTNIPTAGLSISSSLTMGGISAPIPNFLSTYATVFEQAIRINLEDTLSTFPNGTDIVIDIKGINGMDIPNSRRIISDSLSVNYDVIILLPCGLIIDCTKAVNEIIPNMLTSASKDLQESCTRGDLLEEIVSAATSEGLVGFENITVNEDDLVFATDENGELIFTVTENDFSQIDLDVLTSPPLSVCQCDESDLTCTETPAVATQSIDVHICLTPKPGIEVTNFGLKLVGSNGFEYTYVSLGVGQDIYNATQFATVVDYNTPDKIRIRVKLLAQFFTDNGGSEYVIASIDAFTMSSQTKHSDDEERHTYEFEIPVQNANEENALHSFLFCLLKILKEIPNY